jgi:DNA alkylation repair enzyme
MAEPLKNIFSPAFLGYFAERMGKISPGFKAKAFLEAAFEPTWEQLELKQRMRHIAVCLRGQLPPDYPRALREVVRYAEAYLQDVGEKMVFEYCFLPDFIEMYGLEHFDHSVEAIETVTRLSSAEFAVRPFLLRYPEKMYPQMLLWSGHESPLVRRLSSEGFRPRLPWGMGIPSLKRDPGPILPVLENLKADPAETVRRSVANCLNDISKDHPELALEMAARWHREDEATGWVVRHALRGLLKKGNSEALAQFGYDSEVEGVVIGEVRVPPSVRLGAVLEFSFLVSNQSRELRPVRLEYRIDYITGSGKISPKVFMVKELELLPAQSEQIRRRQSFADFTTRKHFAGRHELYVLLNGKPMAKHSFWVE